MYMRNAEDAERGYQVESKKPGAITPSLNYPLLILHLLRQTSMFQNGKAIFLTDIPLDTYRYSWILTDIPWILTDRYSPGYLLRSIKAFGKTSQHWGLFLFQMLYVKGWKRTIFSMQKGIGYNCKQLFSSLHTRSIALIQLLIFSTGLCTQRIQTMSSVNFYYASKKQDEFGSGED